MSTLDHIDAALDSLPYNEDLKPGSQLRRDWIAIRDALARAKARLVTMERAKQ